jgi:hypothetical protein
MRQATRGEVCRDAGKAARVGVSVLSTAGFGSPLARDERDLPLPSRSKSDHGLKITGNLANVG